MRIPSLAAVGLPLLLAAACATTPVRSPVTFAPQGTYIQVQPEPSAYTAVSLTDRAYNARVGNDLIPGEHWVDDEGFYYRVDNTGPCAGMESVWTYDVSGDRVTLNLVSDQCRARNLAQTYVFERTRR